MRKRTFAWAAALLLAGCGEAEPAGNAVANLGAALESEGEAVGNSLNNLLEPVVNPPATDRWIGRWTGVEGLTLEVAKDPDAAAGHYLLRMQYGLDAADAGTFKGVADGDTIRFTRPDGAQALRATDGDATGLKYLAGKRDCLTVKPGEGYCRD